MSIRRNTLLATLGIGLLLFGAATVFSNGKRDGLFGTGRRRRRPGRGRPMLRGAEQAPVIGRHTIGGMTTQLRASPDMSIEERLATIQDLVHQSVQDPRIRKLALQITSKCPERDGKCEAEAVYQAIKKRVRYTGDIGPIKLGRNGPVEGIDLFQSAYRTWEFGGGDCDDHAILASALLAANGLEPQLRVTAESRGGDWGHIYALAGLPKEEPSKWVALDTTLPGNKRFGYEVPFAKKVDFPA